MHIMITNDDGIRAEGLLSLCREAVGCGHRVTVVAPDRERSANSHALSIMTPIRLRTHAVEGTTAYSADGTPVDCARLGLYLLRDDRPDIVLSGINRGQNIGGACIYSGTVGAAMEASMAGCPAMATSLNSSHADADYAPTARVTLKMAEWALLHPLPRGVIYNLNVPALPYDKILGLRVAQLGPTFLTEPAYQHFRSSYRGEYYFLADGENNMTFPEDSDEVLLNRGYATVSALTWKIEHPDGMDIPEIRL